MTMATSSAAVGSAATDAQVQQAQESFNLKSCSHVVLLKSKALPACISKPWRSSSFLPVRATQECTQTAATGKPGKYGGRAKTTRTLNSVAVLPLFSIAAELTKFEFTSFYDDWTLDEKSVKNIYLCFSLFFVWGCCVFGSMKDPFYDSDLYRDAGGDGSANWVYKLEEEEEVEAREELWREELAREIDERVEELRKLEEGEKEKELV